MLKAVLVRKFDKNFVEVLKGSGLAFIVKVLAAAGAFLLNLVIARQLGAEEAGYFYLALSIISLLAVLSMQGFNNAIVRFISSYRADGEDSKVAQVYTLAIKRIVPVAFFISLMVFIFSGLISTSLFAKPSLDPVLAVMALAIVPFALSQTHGFVFQGMKRIVASMLSLSAALPVILIPLLLLLGVDNATQAARCYLLASMLVCVWAFFYWKSESNPFWRSPEKSLVDEVVAPLKSLFLIVLMAQLTMWMGQLILGVTSSAKDVALFASAQRTALLTSFILIAVNAIAAPKFAEFYRKNDFEGLRATAVLSSRLMSAVALPMLVVMLFGAEWLMSLFGNEFSEGAVLLQILAVGQFVNVITGSVGYLLQMTGKEKQLRNNMFYSSCILIVFGPPAAILYGATGMAVVTASSLSIQNLLSVYQVKKQLGFNTMKVW